MFVPRETEKASYCSNENVVPRETDICSNGVPFEWEIHSNGNGARTNVPRSVNRYLLSARCKGCPGTLCKGWGGLEECGKVMGLMGHKIESQTIPQEVIEKFERD